MQSSVFVIEYTLLDDLFTVNFMKVYVFFPKQKSARSALTVVYKRSDIVILATLIKYKKVRILTSHIFTCLHIILGKSCCIPTKRKTEFIKIAKDGKN